MIHTYPDTNEDKVKLESTLHLIDERLQRLTTLDKLASQLVFTDISKAQKYLAEILQILQDYDQPDFVLNYNLNMALVENQLYNFNLSEIHFRLALEILGERGDVNQLAETYIDYAGTLLNLDQPDRARFYLNQATKYLEAFPDNRLKVRLICREGFFHLKFSNYPKALKAFLDCELEVQNIAETADLKDYHFFTLIQSGLGTIYGLLNESERSVQAYLNVVELCEQKGMRSRLSWHYLNVGNGYMAMQDYENASLFFKKAIKVVDDLNQQTRALAYANLGYCYLNKRQFHEALELFTTAYPLFKDRKEKNLANIEWWRGKIYEEQKAKKALKHYFKALEFAKKGQEYRQATGILKDIADLYAKEMDFKNAFDYQVLYNQAVERFMFDERDNQIREMEIRHTAEQKEKEAEMFKLQAAGLQLKALRAQMNPHFVFNALNSVQNYITSNDTTQAAKYLAQFAHLMRQSLEYSELEVISLEKEIEFLRNYIEINMNLRFEDQLKYEINIDEDIEEDIYGVPTMIIQPYVENAIEHGIRSKRKGSIKIDFRLFDENTILCVVEDDGIGREKARELQMKNPSFKDHKSMGTRITQERLQILLRTRNMDQNAVEIYDLEEENSGKALGTKVEILIPIMEIQMK
ncbi:MAG: histidine kinase [Saprospiraceae bacterium]|nr:histidine kinase [Saprospiraceae bacterium]